MARYFVPPQGVQRQQAGKTVSQAVAGNRNTHNDGAVKNSYPNDIEPPQSPLPVNAALQPMFMGRGRSVIDSIRTPSNRDARSAVGGGAPLGIPRYQRGVSSGGTSPAGERPRAQSTQAGAFRPGAPPLMMSADTVKKASGYNPRITPPAHFGAKAAVKAAQQKGPSLFADSPLGQNSPTFVRSSSGGFRPPAAAGDAQRDVSVPQRAMPPGMAIAAVEAQTETASRGKGMAKGPSMFRPPSPRVKSSTGAGALTSKSATFPTVSPKSVEKMAQGARPLPMKPGVPGAPGMKQ